MKQQTLSNRDIAAITGPLALMLHAGISTGDALTLLSEDEPSPQRRELLSELAKQTDFGLYLSRAIEDSGQFPVYVSSLLAVGERTGRTEEALTALTNYYESRELTARRIRSSLTYPAILLALMLIVIVVLLSRVLPVFDDVYASLGGQLTGVAKGLLMLGTWLDAATPILCVLLALALGGYAVFSLHSGARTRILALWQQKMGDRGISRKLNDARFAEALAMGLASGLSAEEAAELSAALLKDIPSARKRCENCRQLLLGGMNLPQALQEANMLPRSACRLLEIGLRGGSGDTAMANIAASLSDDANQSLDELVAKVEPSLVLVTSLLVGVILLSVMLPLMHIMTAIG